MLSSGTPLVNVTGNHDVGYAAEISFDALAQFEKSFGPVNNQFIIGGHSLLNLNSLNLDSRFHHLS